jgi:hypothetical protein
VKAQAVDRSLALRGAARCGVRHLALLLGQLMLSTI